MKLNMKAERIRNGLTIQQVAQRLKISPNAISRWELGKAAPNAQHLIELSKFYRVTPDYLLEEFDLHKNTQKSVTRTK